MKLPGDRLGTNAARYLAPTLCFVGGAVSCLVILWAAGTFKPPEPRPIEIRSGGYRFVNPLLECETTHEYLPSDDYRFRERIKAAASGMIGKQVTNVAIYYRDLNNGPWFGINETTQFLPASLLKVPIMIAFFKNAENSPGLLDRKVRFTSRFGYQKPGEHQLIPPSREIEVGREYSIRELIEAAIERSDNQAILLLHQYISPRDVRETYLNLGVADSVLNSPTGRISVKDYASFLRILYNASYLSHDSSEEALRLLSRSEYPAGIVAGVPPGTPVAHKFGESGSSTEHQLHDCGIVYHPRKPYLLCIMTEGRSFDALQQGIKTISELVYSQIADHQ